MLSVLQSKRQQELAEIQKVMLEGFTKEIPVIPLRCFEIQVRE